ncbi:helix-turn-helix domain-containing protein [Bacillus sp. 1P06AnD]|uniref:helix-turn-helix domain-containing protein n=1 Tax=Bacillus sp. 1P06AnD TaxID=3132208 RepID=UPI0039A1B622
MELTEVIKKLCKERGISVADLEDELSFGKNTIYQWKKKTPSIDRIQKIADYFDVSTDYLLGRSPKKRYWDLTDKDEKTIQRQLEQMINDMNTVNSLSFSKESEPMDEETRKLLIISLENSLRMGKELSKKKFTPKKYRGEDQ